MVGRCDDAAKEEKSQKSSVKFAFIRGVFLQLVEAELRSNVFNKKRRLKHSHFLLPLLKGQTEGQDIWRERGEGGGGKTFLNTCADQYNL